MRENVKKNLKDLGFEEEVQNVEQNRCPFCKKEIDENDFRDELSKREYKISGLCQACMDSIFGKD
jgi:hypothetical protein